MNKTREEWCEELCDLPYLNFYGEQKMERDEVLRIIDSITRQAKVEALQWSVFTPTWAVEAELTRLKEKV